MRGGRIECGAKRKDWMVYDRGRIEWYERRRSEWNEKRKDWLAWEEKGFNRMRIAMNGKSKDLWMRRERNERKWEEEWINLLSRGGINGKTRGE
jgi:hypothetical protein